MGTGSKIAQDIKAGIKGIHGAGEALRGETLQATDELFDNSNKHTETEASKLKNEAIAEKGKRDYKNADDLIGKHHGVASTTATTDASTNTVRGSQGTAAPVATGRAGDEYVSSSRVGA
ncbi:hypothetical protein SLS53_000226 [Cytospora paraplurivora]|uniref:Uncharacterized protein n=1 Tax=Cytospora paraplurivora TaxID=2898453 RepID=A0AAN9UX18_9PEZI